MSASNGWLVGITALAWAFSVSGCSSSPSTSSDAASAPGTATPAPAQPIDAPRAPVPGSAGSAGNEPPAAPVGSESGPVAAPSNSEPGQVAPALVPSSPASTNTATGAGGTADTLGAPGSFGADTPGGRGGRVVRVTTLAPTGPGSLSEALELTGPRIIVFEVGGIIDLDRARLAITQPFVTIAGQTAPSPGITLIRGAMTVRTHDVRVQHLRVRMGDAGAAPAGGFEPDVTTDGADAFNILFDHVSVAWGVDENLSVSGPRFDGPAATSHAVTIRNSIIAEGLNDSVHEKGEHSMGTLIHDYCTGVAVVGNLYAHNDERNPWFKGFATGVIVNNLVYDPGTWAIRLGPVVSEWVDSVIEPEGPRVSVVGNVLLHGPSTPASLAMVGSNSFGSAYLEDNLAFDVQHAPALLVAPTITVLPEKPSWPEDLTPLPAADVQAHVLASAGARPRERDAVDQRIVAEVLAGSGGLIDGQDEVGGCPIAVATQRALDVPEDVEAWLADMAREVE